MKIYFYRYNSICEPDVIDSFKRLELQVDEETIEMYKKDLLPSDNRQIVPCQLMAGNNHLFLIFFQENFPKLIIS